MNIVSTFLENRYHLFITDRRSYNVRLTEDNECQCLRKSILGFRYKIKSTISATEINAPVI